MKPQLVLDANAFINLIDLHKLHERFDFVSTFEALNEVRDQKAREKMQNLPFEIKSYSPSESAVKFTKIFAKATGDLNTLSSIDINLIAVAYTILEEQKKTGLIRTQPPKPMEFKRVKNQVQGKAQEAVQERDSNTNNENEDDDEWTTVEDTRKHPQPRKVEIVKEEEKPQQQPEEEEKESQQEEDDDTEEDEEEGGEWVTTDNIQDHLTGVLDTSTENEDVNKLGIAVLTADYAMQNVLLQMGIPVISQEGYQVKQAKRFILECHICKVLVRDSSKLFCPDCGNNSLLKVSCSVNSDGTLVLYRKKNFKINLRGTQFTIPKSSTNKHDQLLIREDQLLMSGLQQKMKREKQQADQKYKKMMLNYDNGFGFDDIEFKQNKGQAKLVVGYGKLNPNDPSDMKKIKGKRAK